MTSNGRVARLTALALATGTLVAAGAGAASAATTSKDVFTATGAGNVISLNLNLPVDIPTIGNQITQDLVTTGTSVRTSGLDTPAAALSKALLGSRGNVPVVSQVLEKSVQAEYGKNGSVEQGGFPANPLLVGGILQLVGKTANPDLDSVTPAAYSKSSVIDLKIDGGANLAAVLNAIVGQVQANLTSVIGTLPTGGDAAPISGVTTTLTDVLNTVSKSLPSAVPTGSTQQVTDLVNQIAGLLDNLPQAISQDALHATTADTSLLKVGVVKSEQTVTHTAGVVTSHANNAIENISLLGGLITLDSLTSEATAALGHDSRDASATGHASILKLNVEGVLSLEITNELKALLKSPVLPAAVVDAVNQVLNTVTDTLKTALGAVLVVPKTGSVRKSADEAYAEESAAHLVVQPVGFAKPIVDLALIPAVAKVTKVHAQATTNPTLVPAKASAQPVMAHTGANFGLTAPIAAGLLGMAFVARRRRMATMAD